LPRVLMRLPYGAGTDPIESFTFDELDTQRRHSDYLWGNPAFAIARLLCAGFQEDGWDMQPDAHRALDDLPAHIYTMDGTREMQACAEVYLSEHEGEELAAQGFMTLLSMKGRPEARLLRFQSIAEPPVALRGAWA
jgi:type VI secretion system protein ImpC